MNSGTSAPSPPPSCRPGRRGPGKALKGRTSKPPRARIALPGPPGREPGGGGGERAQSPEPRGEAPGQEGQDVRLPRRPGPEGEAAACAGPAGGYGGGAQRAGPEGEPRGHGCGCGAVSKPPGAWAAPPPQSRGGPGSIALTQPRPGGNFKSQRRRRQGRSGWGNHARARSGARARARSPPGARPPRKAPWDGAGSEPRARHPGMRWRGRASGSPTELAPSFKEASGTDSF